ncbi:hypothetical protein NEMIN01_0133 [Nematocida minor]|uniref:uncharacterized protein n=1 Tax=Nematocida minor TaxID=1912983 RepID=UPI00221E7A82|nr:uncharacterized protein NEMIN01_0029 [Nematocida minor]XP_051332035.1 uncharacterized protein NEMIN01_0133 [Nematocida minor]KAI5188765.1 hypothetical protein NEMIN01_0029 [Nematocida minor]KAI5188869.1 hypothetical protein NEMIN01_0133 [Nematocida minor]
MEKRAYNECCYKMLSILNTLKDFSLGKTELENNLTELNRLITLVTNDQEVCPVHIEKVGDKKYIIKNTHIEEQDGEVKILKTDILQLSSYFQTLPLKKQPIEEALEYIKTVNENRVCMVCLRRASESTLLSPLVMRKKENEILMYHVECAEESPSYLK